MDRLMIDLSNVYEKVKDQISAELFRSTVRVIVEQHYIKEGLIKK